MRAISKISSRYARKCEVGVNRYKKLLSDTFIYGIGTFASKLLVFFLTRLYTECLTEAEYGKADLITNMANLLIPLAAAGLCDGIFRFTLDSETDKRSVFTTGIVMLAATGGIFAVLSPLLMLSEYFRSYAWLIAAYVLMSNFHSACAQYIRACDRTKLFAIQGILNTCLTIAFNLIFFLVLPDSNILNGVYGYVLSIVLADLLVGLFLFIYAGLWRDLGLKYFSRPLASSMLKYSVPMIPTAIFWWITNVSDRYMVTAFRGEAENGLYTAAYKIPTVLTLVTGVFSEAWQFSAVKTEDPEERSKFYTNVFSGFQGLIFVAGSLIIAFAQVFAALLFAKNYFTAWSFIPVLTLASVFSGFVNFLSSIYLVKKRSVKSFLTAMTGALTNIFLNFLLIPDSLTLFGFTIPCVGLGALGAALATAVSYIVVFIIRAADTRKMVRFDLGVLRLIINSLILSAQGACLMFSQSLVFTVVSQTVGVAAMGLVNFRPLLSTAKGILGALKRKKS